MDRQDFIRHIRNKQKGILLDPKDQAEMLDHTLEIAQSIYQKTKDIEEEKVLLKQLNTNFPLIYREAKRIFNTPKEPKP